MTIFSGIARFAAGRRVGASFPRSFARKALPSAFTPFQFNAVRFASTETQRAGKIHQVIGAVVDGMYFTIGVTNFYLRRNFMPLMYKPH